MKIAYIVPLFFILVSAIYFSPLPAVIADALSVSDISYPVEELDGCKSEEECKEYCNNPDNADKCLDFAVKNGLMSEKEINVARKFLKKEIEGPGGCDSKESCESYCNDVSHIDECVSFVEENNLIPDSELDEYKKVQSAIKRGAKMPACKNKEECESYCKDSSHIEECVSFGIEAGFLEGKEKEDALKMMEAIKKGITPPPCGGRDECEAYCNEADHMETCLNFAIEAGFMPEDERENAGKMLSAIKRGIKPLTCGSKEKCEVYCSEDGHMEECVAFAEAAGFMTSEEAEMARKTGGKGPGGCSGREECEAFCQNGDNREVCFNFAKEHGLMKEEDQRMMEEGRGGFMNALNGAPEEVMKCLEGKVGADVLEKIKNGGMASEKLGETLKECFSAMRQEGGSMMEGNPPPCNNEEECEALKLRMEQDGQMLRENVEENKPPEGINNEEVKRQYEQQFEEQKRMMEEQERQRQEQYEAQKRMMEEQKETHSEPTSFLFGNNSLFLSSLYSIFQYVMGNLMD